MPLSLEVFAAWATIIGTAVSLLALLESRAWLVLISLFFVCVSLAAIVHIRRGRRTLDAASMVIEGRSIDSLNIANLRRRLNRTFVIQEAHHTARIEDEDLEITWRYVGYCRAKQATAMDFSIDSDASTPFERLNCVAYDLAHDPDQKHEIRPVLVGTEGISKKISVPFLSPVKANQPIGVLLKCTLPGCVKAGMGYYTSTLSFAQDRVRETTVHLIFMGAAPDWVRVYDASADQPPKLVRNLAPTRHESEFCEYVDVAQDRPGQSARIYMFSRRFV